MQKALFLSLSQLKIFWRLRYLIGKRLFLLKREAYRSKFKWTEEIANSKSLVQLFQSTGLSVLWGIIAAIVLQLIDSLLYRFYQSIGLDILDDSGYFTLLATICGTGGVFIALYYTAISNIGGAIYSRVPNNIRNLFARERVGGVYMRIVAFITLLGLCLVSLRLLGFQKNYLAVPLMAILAGFCIWGFVRLGQRAFYLFDPTILGHNIILELNQCVELATVQGLGWDNPAFQTHVNNRANAALDALVTLSAISSKAKHLNGEPFVELIYSVSRFLASYTKQKRRIPSKSNWYERKYLYKDFYKTGDIEVSLSHDTGTGVRPIVVYNRLWVEEKLELIIIECLRANLLNKRFRHIIKVLEYVDLYLRVLAEEGEVKQAYAFLSKVAATALNGILNDEETLGVQRESVECLAIADFITQFPINIALSYLENISYLSKEKMLVRLGQLRWHRSKEIYSRDFLAFSLPCLEWLEKRIRFEISTDGRPISPIWYQTELVLQTEAEKFKENCVALLESSPRLYSNWIDLVDKKDRPWLGAAILSREWEYWPKILFQIDKLFAVWEDIGSERHIEGMDWPEMNPSELLKGINERKKIILRRMSEKSILSTLQSRPADYPDYAGQFLHNVGEAIFSSMADLDLETVRSTFKPYFYGCLLQFEKMKPHGPVTEWRTQIGFKMAAAPLIDLMDLSGYGFLFSELYEQRELWEVIKRIWDEFLDADPGPEKGAVFSASIGLTESAFELPHRATLRARWHSEVNRKLRLHKKEEAHDDRGDFMEPTVPHQSPLIRLFARDRLGGFHDGIDIFVSLYLYKRSDIKRLPLRWRRLELQNELAKEEERYKIEKAAQREDQ